MTDLEKAQSVVASLSQAEKIRVLEWIVRDLGKA
jgi:hypothetical protein